MINKILCPVSQRGFFSPQFQVFLWGSALLLGFFLVDWEHLLFGGF